jgi:hypothetical protein
MKGHRAPAPAVLSLIGPLLERGVLRQDLLGVASGLRPACRFLLPRADGAARAELERFRAAAGLSSLEYAESGSNAPISLLGARPEPLAEIARLDAEREARSRSPDDGSLAALSRRIGVLLGYPACCVAAFDERLNDRAAALARSAERLAPFPFTTNFLFSFQSRGYGSNAQLERLWKRGYRASGLYLLPWIPCRFDCAPSAAFGARLFALLQGFDPGFARAVRLHLAATILYRDDWSFIPLLGARRAGAVRRYRRALDAGTLLPPRFVRALEAGTSVALLPDGSAEVRAGGRALERLAGPWTFFDFGPRLRFP